MCIICILNGFAININDVVNSHLTSICSKAKSLSSAHGPQLEARGETHVVVQAGEALYITNVF